MTRIIDLIAVLIVALLVLLPQPGVVVQPALSGDKADLDRLAVLEDAVYRVPEDVDAAVDLARVYLRIEQPGWAVAALKPHLGRSDYRVHQVMASAYATLLKPDLALGQAEAGIKASDAAGPRCPEPAQIRLQYIANLVRNLARLGIDPARDPLKAKLQVQAELRATKSYLPNPAAQIKISPPQGSAPKPVAPAAPAPPPATGAAPSPHAP